MIGIYLCSLLSMDLLSVSMAYFVSCVRHVPPPNFSIFTGVVAVGGIAFFPGSLYLSHRYGKGRAFIASAILFLAGLGGISLWGNTSGSWGSGFIALVAVLGVLGLTIFPWTMFPDAADVGRLAWGYSSPGSFGGIMTLFRKLSSAFAIFLMGLALDAAGYINPSQINEGGGLRLERIPQPPEVVLMIRLLLPLLPLLLLTLAVILAWRYPLKHRTYDRLAAYLKHRDGGAAEGALSDEELKALKERLI